MKPVFGLQCRVRGTITWAVLGDRTETNHGLTMSYLHLTYFRTCYKFHRLKIKSWKVGIQQNSQTSHVFHQLSTKRLKKKKENTFLTDYYKLDWNDHFKNTWKHTTYFERYLIITRNTLYVGEVPIFNCMCSKMFHYLCGTANCIKWWESQVLGSSKNKPVDV